MLIRRYLRASGATAGAEVVQLTTAFVNIWILTAVLGTSEFGVYLLAFSLAAVPVFFVVSTIERPAFLKLARLDETSDDGDRAGLSGAALIGAGAIGLFIGGVLWSAAPALAAGFGLETLRTWLRGMALVPAAFAIRLTLASCLQAQRRVEIAACGGVILPAMMQTGLFLLVLPAGLGQQGVIAATTLAPAISASFLLTRLAWRPANPLAVYSCADLTYGAQLSGLRFLTHGETRLDTWLVALVGSGESIALYTVGRRFASLLEMGKRALDSMLVPRMGRALTAGEGARRKLQSEVRIARSAAFGASLAGLTLLALMSKPVLQLIGGYEASIPILLILSAAVLVETGTGTAGQLIVMRGEAAALLLPTALSAATFLVTALLLGSVFGPMGVALGALLGYSVRNSFAVVLVKQHIGITILPLGSAAIVALAAAAVALAGAFGGDQSALWTVASVCAAAGLAVALEGRREWTARP